MYLIVKQKSFLNGSSFVLKEYLKSSISKLLQLHICNNILNTIFKLLINFVKIGFGS